MDRSKILEILQVVESSPSAHILVKSFIEPVLDTEADEIYELSEGYNDQQTEKILNAMNDSELLELTEHLKSRVNEVDKEDKNIVKLIKSL